MKDDIKEILITEEQIREKIEELAAQLTKDYEGKFPLVVGVLKGATLFMADILKKNGYILGNGFYGCFQLRNVHGHLGRSENFKRFKHLR